LTFHPKERTGIEGFKCRALRIIIWLKRDQKTRGWRLLHNGVFRNLYASINIITVIKLSIMRGAVHVTHGGQILKFVNFLSQYLKERGY